MPYNDAILNDVDRQKVQALQAQWQEYNKAGDQAGMDSVHKLAESIRSGYGYSGGADGSGYTALSGTGAGNGAVNGGAAVGNPQPYQATGSYSDSIMSDTHRAQVAALSDAYKRAQAAGDTAGMEQAHAQAEAIRALYGYSGGADGSEYVRTGTNTQLYSAKPQTEALNAAYDAQIEADRAALDAAQNQKLLEFDRAEQKIAPNFDAQRNNTAAQYQIGARNLAERFNALGLGSGANAQMQLSQNNTFQKNMNTINAAEAEARNDLEFERLKAKTAYQDAIVQAIKDGDAARANALYQEAVRVDNSLVSTSANQTTVDLQREATAWDKLVDQADTLAKFGDFSGYKALGYDDASIARMQAVWNAENADLLALMNGGSTFSGGGSGGTGGSGGSGGGSKTGSSGNSGSKSTKTGKLYGEIPDSTDYEAQDALKSQVSNRIGTDAAGTRTTWIEVTDKYGRGTRMTPTEVLNGVNKGTISEKETKSGKLKYSYK